MNGAEAPLVSVVVPVHGRQNLAARAIGSVAGQTHRPIELIVVDDASDPPFRMPPETPGLDVRLVRLEQNRGPGAAREAGRRIAGGDFVAYLDSDDLWAPPHLASLVAALSAAPEAGMAYSAAMEMRDGRPSALRRWNDQACTAILPTLLWRRPWHTSACVWRRPLVDAMGGWMPIWHWEDHEHDARAGCLGARLVGLAEPTCFVEVDSAGRLSANPNTRRRVEGYSFAMLSIAERIRGCVWFGDAEVRARMRDILLAAAIRACEHGLAGLAARTAFASWRWPRPPASLAAASVAAVALAGLGHGAGAARILRWARRRLARASSSGR